MNYKDNVACTFSRFLEKGFVRSSKPYKSVLFSF